MPPIGKRWHELRITNKREVWRIIYRIDDDALIIGVKLAESLRKTRVSLHLTQEKVATLLRSSQSRVSKMEPVIHS